MGVSSPSRSRICTALAAFLVSIALTRIVATYSSTAQAFDEPCHVAAGMEFLDKGTYTLDAVHPPLARIAIGLPLYISGERYPNLPPQDPDSRNYNIVGNHILYDSGHLIRNLTLARLGVLPFFVLGALVVFLWARHAGGDLAALVAVLLYSTTPTIVAFSSIAYTDIVAASTQLAAMFAFCLWLESPDRAHTLWLGLALGAAFLAKLTSVLFLPAAALAITIPWWLARRKEQSPKSFAFERLIAALALAALVVWMGYFFSFRPLHEATGISPSSMPSFQHFPGPLRSAARDLVLKDPRLPAPELLHGVALAWALNKTSSMSYLFGHLKPGGWWYFYLVALGVKLPLPLLILALASIVVLANDTGRNSVLFPLAALLAVLLITMHVSYQVGVRHILVCFPLIAIVAGQGGARLLERASWRSIGTWAVVLFLAWQMVESVRAQSEFLAYFNQFAGKDPGKVLVLGCDLDCGQDLFRLAHELRSRHTDHCALAVWSSADIDRVGLPQHDPIDTPDHLHGCIALSARALRVGDVLHQSLGPGYFDALDHYPPAANIGRTIRLYYLPERP